MRKAYGIPPTPEGCEYPAANLMNNAAYVVELDNAAWDAYAQAGLAPGAVLMQALAYDVEYLESARFGEQLEISTWLDPTPASGQEFTRLQQIKRGETLLVRARSRWLCQHSR